MHVSIVNRLVSARFLLWNSGPQLNRHSGSRLVAQAVLAAHDASELTLAAISEHLQTGLSDKSTFVDLAKVLNEKLAPRGLPGFSYFNRLNKVRVAFKHHGELPDSGSWFGVTEVVTNHLNVLCKLVFGAPLEEIDLVDLIEDEKAKSFIKAAIQARDNGLYKEALESLARALYSLMYFLPSGIVIPPGEPDAELALVLTGYGIDPSSFIVLQQMLPTGSPFGFHWDPHKYGHPLNWTEQNTQFCIETLTNVLIQLQQASPRPQPISFYSVFRDVLTVCTEKPEVRKGQLLDFDDLPVIFGTPTPLSGFSPGDKIYGRASACSDSDGRFPNEDQEIDTAEWLRVTDASIGIQKLAMNEFLVVRRSDVEISYEKDPRPAIEITRGQGV